MPPRVDMTNSVCNCGRDSTRPPGPATDLRTGTRILTRVVSSHPSPDARRSSQSTSSWSSRRPFEQAPRQSSVVGFRSWPRRTRTAGQGLGSRPRFGDGVDQSVVAALVADRMCRARSTKRPAGTDGPSVPNLSILAVVCMVWFERTPRSWKSTPRPKRVRWPVAGTSSGT